MRSTVYRNRVSELRKKFSELGVDTVWVMRPENRRYLSGFTAVDHQVDESSGSLFISSEEAFLLTDGRYTVQAEAEADSFKVITYKEGFLNELPGVFERLKTRKLGFESDYLIWDLYQKVKERASQHRLSVELIPILTAIEEMRQIKDAQEIRSIIRSAYLMGDVLSKIIEELRPGQVEKDIAWKIETLVREAGADGSAFPPIVASGPNSALPHATPTSRRIKEGEPVILDVGAIVDGYCSDMTRTVFIGEPVNRFKELYRVVRKAQVSALELIKPGMQSSEADSCAREIIQQAGFGDFFTHSLGHGIGLATHESPSLSARKPGLLKEGMVFTIEPGIYLPGEGGVRLEEMAILKKDGSRLIKANNDFYAF